MIQLPDKVRAFIALRMSGGTERALARFIDEIRRNCCEIRWTPAEKLHLTLRFLGDAIDSALLPPLAAELDKIAAAGTPFAIEARGVGAFPNLSRPRVLWVGLEGTGLMGLAARIEEAAVRCGFAPEMRPYSPHLTIGRVRGMRGWERVRAALEASSTREFGRSTVEEVILYRSILDTKSYQELGRYRLGPPFAAKV